MDGGMLVRDEKMRSFEIRQLRARLGESRRSFSRHFGTQEYHVSWHAVRSWERDEEHPAHRNPGPIAQLILAELQRQVFGET